MTLGMCCEFVIVDPLLKEDGSLPVVEFPALGDVVIVHILYGREGVQLSEVEL